MLGRPVFGEVGEDRADQHAELEAVPRARRSDHDLRVLRVPVDDEVLVGRGGVAAGLRAKYLAGGLRQPGRDKRPQRFELRLVDRAVVACGIDLRAALVERDLYSRQAKDREAIRGWRPLVVMNEDRAAL